MKRIMILLFAGFSACTTPAPKKINIASKHPIPEITINQIIDSLKQNKGLANNGRVEKGIKNAASLWQPEDGSADDFIAFCLKNIIIDDTERALFFDKVSRNLESVFGHFNKISLDLKENVDLNNWAMLEIDK